MEAAEILISARTDPVWRPSDTEFVADPTAAGPSRGALSGLAAALARIRTKYLLALAIDMPFMTEKYLHFLCDEIAPGRGVLAVIAGRAEPLAAIYPAEAHRDVIAALSGSGADFSLQSLTSHLVKAGKLQVIPVAEGKKAFFGTSMNQLIWSDCNRRLTWTAADRRPR